MKNKDWIDKIIQDIKKDSPIKILLIGVLISFCGLYTLFVAGFHNFDMAQNLIFIRDNLKIDLLKYGMNISVIERNMNYVETTLHGETWSLEETYVNGIRSFLNGIFITMFGIGAVGYALGKFQK